MRALREIDAAGWRRALLLGVLLAGLYSMVLGQDANWDLRNYHLYGPYSLLNGKVGVDLAPGQWQGYFNPTLDLLYYGLVMHLPAPLTSLLMGLLHGVNFVLLALLGVALLPRRDGQPARGLALLLAALGCLGPAFLSQLGNTMGDNATALCVLGGLLVAVRGARATTDGAAWQVPSTRHVLGAGLLLGIGAGLKLTNATYALALCLALLVLPGRPWLRVRAAWLYGWAVLGGMALAAGHWYWRMWQTFGNPLFPQFNNLFGSPLAAPVGIGDTAWLPKSLLERVLWPFICLLDPRRISELPFRHLLWPLLYVLGIVLLVLALRAVWRRRPGPLAGQGGTAFVLAFSGIAYLLWLNLFSIYRYLVPQELLAPLLCWLALTALLPGERGRRLALACVLLGGLSLLSRGQWGHAGRPWEPFHVEQPKLQAPAATAVVTLAADPPLGWLVPFYPKEVVFISLSAGFPESPGYVARAKQVLQQRPQRYVIMGPGPMPTLELAQPQLLRYGLQASPHTCRQYGAHIGNVRTPYTMCELVIIE
ncbi:hypothetical protein [Pseudoduganella sp.]|uniref:hypothetical protein n=1 Tax=Pseudoduganella sp. TaxID=1880898 RepID=UPI0035B37C96